MPKVKVKLNVLTILSLIYMYISCFLFSAFWLKKSIAILVTIALLVSLISMSLFLYKNEETENEYIEFNAIWFAFLILIIFSVGLISGWSGYGYQTADWPKHNAILNDLLTRRWPVIYENNGEKALLTYYIGQYLFPAFVGKIFHTTFKTMLLVNWLWSSLGLCLVVLLFMVCARAETKKRQLFCFLFIILAGGMMALQQEIGFVIYPDFVAIGKEGWEDYFYTYGYYMLQFRTNFVSLRWAYGQTLVPWMISIILYKNWNKVAVYIPLVVPCLLFGSFSSVSLIVLAIAFFVKYCIKEKNLKNILVQTFSWQNILSFFSFGIVLFIYYLGYILQEKPDSMRFQFITYPGRNIGLYLLFVLGSFGLYALVIAREYRKSVTFWICVIVMSILPFFKGGSANDLLMGACIAPSMLLYLLIAEWLFADNNMLLFRKGVMTVLLVVGFLKPTMEIYYCIHNYDYTKYEPNMAFGESMIVFVDRDDEDIPLDLRYNYYTYDANSSLFMNYIGEKIKDSN